MTCSLNQSQQNYILGNFCVPSCALCIAVVLSHMAQQVLHYLLTIKPSYLQLSLCEGQPTYGVL
jgi:hypothetical protein